MSNLAKNNTLGGDPEFFIYDNQTKKTVPSCGLIGGKKGQGVPFINNVKTYRWLEDNVTVELNFPPAKTNSGFLDTVYSMHQHIEAKLIAINKNYRPRYAPSSTFDIAELSRHEGAMEMGCEADFCAYLDEKRRPPISITKLGLNRFAGGHLHLGYSNPDQIPAWAIAMLCDAWIGLPSIYYDNQELRRSFYGLAGLYREKPYGLEYRTMSNWWLRPDNKSINATRNMGRSAFALMSCISNSPARLAKYFSDLPLLDIKEAIDKQDVKTAQTLFPELARSASSSLGVVLEFYPEESM